MCERQTARIRLKIALVLKNATRCASPRIIRCDLPLPQLLLQLGANFHEVLSISDIHSLIRVSFQVEKLKLRSIVVALEAFVPRQRSLADRSIEDVLEGPRDVKVLIDGEGQVEVDVVDEFVAVISSNTHRIRHGDLVEVVTAVNHRRVIEWLLVEDRQQTFPCQATHFVPLVTFRHAKPIEEGRHQIQL